MAIVCSDWTRPFLAAQSQTESGYIMLKPFIAVAAFRASYIRRMRRKICSFMLILFSKVRVGTAERHCSGIKLIQLLLSWSCVYIHVATIMYILKACMGSLGHVYTCSIILISACSYYI